MFSDSAKISLNRKRFFGIDFNCLGLRLDDLLNQTFTANFGRLKLNGKKNWIKSARGGDCNGQRSIRTWQLIRRLGISQETWRH